MVSPHVHNVLVALLQFALLLARDTELLESVNELDARFRQADPVLVAMDDPHGDCDLGDRLIVGEYGRRDHAEEDGASRDADLAFVCQGVLCRETAWPDGQW